MPVPKTETETGEFPAQMASNAENVSIWWRHHVNSLFVPGISYHLLLTKNMLFIRTTSHGRNGVSITGNSIVCSTVCSGYYEIKTMLRISGHLKGPTQRARNAENVSMFWRHHVQIHLHHVIMTYRRCENLSILYTWISPIIYYTSKTTDVAICTRKMPIYRIIFLMPYIYNQKWYFLNSLIA